jgi:hypothetical protein
LLSLWKGVFAHRDKINGGKDMNKILAAAFILGMGGGAYAAQLEDLAVRAADIKAAAGVVPGPAAAVPVAGEKADVTARTYEIRCRYSDAVAETLARFSMIGTYKVAGRDAATLSYSATINYVEGNLSGDVPMSDVAGPAQPAPVVFSVGKNVKNLPKYHGTKYVNHFKFPLEWNGVDASIDRADLIISKEPVSTEKDQYGATLRTFTGALDVSYNDHHGDFVQTVCVQREFE